jgi:putative membrane protein
MAIEVRLLAELDLIVQLILAVVLLVASRLARARDFKKHCALMRFAVPVQILAILGVMLPSMYGYSHNPSTDPLLDFEILIHHTLGLMVVALWTYINLIFMNVLKPKIGIKTMMRLALGCWAASMVLGLYLYWSVYLSRI